MSLDAGQSQLIGRHLAFYQALHDGTRLPGTPAQHHFVAVMAGRTCAETPHEIAYAAYLSEQEVLPPSLLYRFRRLEAGEDEATEAEDVALLRALRRGFPPANGAQAAYLALRRAERVTAQRVGEVEPYPDGAHPVPLAVAQKWDWALQSRPGPGGPLERL